MTPIEKSPPMSAYVLGALMRDAEEQNRAVKAESGEPDALGFQTREARIVLVAGLLQQIDHEFQIWRNAF